MRVINGVPQSQAIIPHDVRYDTDPYVTPAAACRDCNCPLEGLRVFAGSTAGMRQHRGRICQTVSFLILIIYTIQTYLFP